MIDWSRITPGAAVARGTLLGGIFANVHGPAPRQRDLAQTAPRTEARQAAWESTLQRSQHTVTTLQDGRILVAGGFNGTPLSSTQIYDSKSSSWTTVGALNIPRYQHTATLLANGRVLVAGGVSIGLLTETEIFDPETGKWSIAAPMNLPRSGHCADLLPDGEVLVSGGSFMFALGGAELFDGTAWSLA